MKRLIKRVLAPLLVAGALFIAEPIKAEEPVSPFIFGGLGLYSGAERAMRDIYGPILKLKGGVGIDIQSEFRGELNLVYSSKKGQPYVYKQSHDNHEFDSVKSTSIFGMLEFIPKIGYVYKKEKVNPYVELGFPVIFFHEKIEADAYYRGESVYAEREANDFGLGFSLSLGLDMPINKKDGLFFYLEGTGSYVQCINHNVNLGGLSLDAGLKKFF